MSQTTRRSKFFKPGKAEYPLFPGWNVTLVDDGKGMLNRLVAMSEEEMASMPQEARGELGIPAVICLHAARRTVEVYPVPAAEFDILVETKSWSAG